MTSRSTLPDLEEAASTNDPVDEETKLAARAVIYSGEAVLRDIRRALAANSYTSMVASLAETEHRILTEIEKCRSITSQNREIPVEVLEQIFLHCAALQPITVWHLPEANPMAAIPWSLTGVCTKWRQIAFNTPALWTRIHALAFKFTTGAEQKRSGLLRNGLGERRLDHVLGRSKNAFLSLRIVWLNDWGYVEIPRLLRATASRLKSLEFKAAPNFHGINPEPRLLAFLDFLASDPAWLEFTELTEVCLHLGEVPMSLRFLRSATNLRTLSLHSTYHSQPLCLTSLHEQLHLENLQRLQISDRELPTEVLYKILCHSPNLESLTVTATSASSVEIPGAATSDLPPEYTHANLAELVIFVHSETSSADTTLWWLERLHLPRLKALHLGTRGPRGPSWSCPAPQLQAIQESNVLRRLTLDIAMYMNDLLRFLQSLPRLEEVELRNFCPARPIVRHFAKADLLPNLSILKCGLYRSRLDEFLHMLHLRTGRSKEVGSQIVPLKRVELVMFPPETRYGEDWSLEDSLTQNDLKVLQDQGWKVQMSPIGWQETVPEFNSPQAVGLIVLCAQ